MIQISEDNFVSVLREDNCVEWKYHSKSKKGTIAREKRNHSKNKKGTIARAKKRYNIESKKVTIARAKKVP